jgi:hypothetical protein
MSYELLPRIEGHIVCLTCGCGPKNDLSMGREIAVGLGQASYSRDGETLWREQGDEETFPTVQDVENFALGDPDHDWRITFYAPLYEAEYQRQGEGQWILVRKGEGFA